MVDHALGWRLVGVALAGLGALVWHALLTPILVGLGGIMVVGSPSTTITLDRPSRRLTCSARRLFGSRRILLDVPLSRLTAARVQKHVGNDNSVYSLVLELDGEAVFEPEAGLPGRERPRETAARAMNRFLTDG